MKRYGNLYDKILDIDNLRLAHKNARKNKTKYKEIVEVDKDPEYYIQNGIGIWNKALCDRSMTTNELVTISSLTSKIRNKYEKNRK